MECRAQANEILAEIAGLNQRIASLEEKASAAVALIEKQYAKHLEPLQAALKARDKEIRGLMKKEVAGIFDGADKVKLHAGILLHTKDFKVTIPRDAVGKIEEQGWLEAIRIAKSVDRPVIEAWPEERLVMIGAKRKLVDKFGYEILTPEH